MRKAGLQPLICRVTLLLVLAQGFPLSASASVTAQAGQYRVELATIPSQIVLGKSQLHLRLTDAFGKPVEGAKIRSLTKMPDMNMGEREVSATAKPGQTGVYTASATFAMEGRYTATLTIEGPQGSATALVPLKTGQDTGTLTVTAHEHGGSTPTPVAGGSDFPLIAYLPWILGGILVAFVIYRAVRAGQRPNWQTIFRPATLLALLLVIVVFLVTRYAVSKYRQPGAMTPIEAQAMDMAMPAPPGTAPVELATVERGLIESTVRYTGQAVGYVEQDVTPRVIGTIMEMNVYAGDRVRRGQLMARLDVSQSTPQVASQQAALTMARQGIGVAQKEYQQALAGVNEARADVATKQDALEGARADLTAAQEERANAQAELDAIRTQTADAEAQVRAAEADQDYWRQEIARMEKLLRAGAVTQEEYQRELAQARNADEKVRQAQARVAQVEAEIRAAQSAVRKADAMIASARSKIAQMQSDVRAGQARIRSAQAMAESAKQRIGQAQTGVEQAQATLAGTSAIRGYSEIRAQVDGVVTQRVISPGVLVNPGQTILRVAQISPIRLQANVPESDLWSVRVGHRATISRQNDIGPPLEARVTSITPAVDPSARTGVVEAVVPNQDRRFVPGQYVTMTITTRRNPNALRIPVPAVVWQSAPSSAVLSTERQAFVWIAQSVDAEQYTVERVLVRVGGGNERMVEILSGLKAGQKIVARGHTYLRPGDTVTAVPWGEEGPSLLPTDTSISGSAASAPTAHGNPNKGGHNHGR